MGAQSQAAGRAIAPGTEEDGKEGNKTSQMEQNWNRLAWPAKGQAESIKISMGDCIYQFGKVYIAPLWIILINFSSEQIYVHL